MTSQKAAWDLEIITNIYILDNVIPLQVIVPVVGRKKQLLTKSFHHRKLDEMQKQNKTNQEDVQVRKPICWKRKADVIATLRNTLDVQVYVMYLLAIDKNECMISETKA